MNATSVAALREMLMERASMAIGVVADLMLTSESDKVKLDAAKTILDRVGAGTFQTVEVHTDQQEHVRVQEELESIQARLAANASAKALAHGERAPEVIMVLEGDLEELPIAGNVDERTVIDVHHGEQ